MYSLKNNLDFRENYSIFLIIFFYSIRVFVTQIVIVILFILYILLGALLFQQIDKKFSSLPFTEVVLFCFTTTSTIGKTILFKFYVF